MHLISHAVLRARNLEAAYWVVLVRVSQRLHDQDSLEELDRSSVSEDWEVNT